MPRGRSSAGSNVKLLPEEIKLLRKLTARFKVFHKDKNKTQGDLIFYLLQLCDVHNLIKEGWDERLTKSLKSGDWQTEENMMRTDPDRCIAISHGKEIFKCVWGRRRKPPMIRLLEKEYEFSKNMCQSCTLTLLDDDERESYEDTIKNLENRLQANADLTFKIPICEAVGVLNGDGTLFSRCQEHNMRAVNIEKFCKVKNDGEPCEWYKESIVGVAEKIK